MMRVWWNEKEFKDLQSEWYEKLKHHGFEDAESSPRYLKEWHSTYFRSHHIPEKIEETRDYFDSALHFYWHYMQFKNEREKQVWWHHCHGKSRREIAELLTSRKKKITDSWVQITLDRLKKIMHSRLWPSSEGALSDETRPD